MRPPLGNPGLAPPAKTLTSNLNTSRSLSPHGGVFPDSKDQGGDTSGGHSFHRPRTLSCRDCCGGEAVRLQGWSESSSQGPVGQCQGPWGEMAGCRWREGRTGRGGRTARLEVARPRRAVGGQSGAWRDTSEDDRGGAAAPGCARSKKDVETPLDSWGTVASEGQ